MPDHASNLIDNILTVILVLAIWGGTLTFLFTQITAINAALYAAGQKSIAPVVTTLLPVLVVFTLILSTYAILRKTMHTGSKSR